MASAIASVALAAVGTAASVYGQVQAGQAQAADAKYQGQIAANNATIAQQNAQRASAAGQAQATATSLKSAATMGRIRAAEAASGVDVNTGSASDVQESQREVGQLDTLTAENNALLNAYGYKVAATSDTAQSTIDSATATQATTGADIGAAGTLLGNASSLGFKWQGLQNNTPADTPAPATFGGQYQ